MTKAHTASPESAPLRLIRSMRQRDLVAVLINGVIGAGIFGLPSKVFALAGNYSLISFGVCAICVSLIVLSAAEVSSRYSGTGGPYLFASDAYGPVAGFTVGWLVWVARVTSFSANSNLLPEYLGFFYPKLASGVPRAIILTAVVLLLTAVNIRGVRSVTTASNAFAIGKLLPLGVFIAAGLFFLEPHRFTLGALPGYHPFSLSVMLLVYAFTGFENALVPAGESHNPERDMPRALITGTALIVVVYILIQVVCIGTLPELAHSQRPLADAAARFLGTGGAVMITVGIVISLAGNLNVLILAGSRTIFAMADGGDLPRFFAAIHPRYRTPAAAVLITTGVMLALTLSGTFIYLVTISTLARLVTYMIMCTALPVLRRGAGSRKEAFRLPGGVFISVAGTLLCVWLLSNSSLREARDTGIAVAAGLAIYAIYRIFRPKAVN